MASYLFIFKKKRLFRKNIEINEFGENYCELEYLILGKIISFEYKIRNILIK